MSKLINTPYGGFHVVVEVKNTKAESAAVHSAIVAIEVYFGDGSVVNTSVPMLCVGDTPNESVAVDWVQAGVDRYKKQLKAGSEPRIDQIAHPRAVAYALITYITATIRERSDATFEFWKKNMD